MRLEDLNDSQKRAVKYTDGALLIIAGAGSGKTRALTNRIAYLIEEKGVAPWNILAITFTNKAAQEMRNRVDALVGMGSESIWVSTFHSSCVRILRRYADRIGYDNNFTIYDTDDQKTVIKDVCKRLEIDTKMLKERTILSAISSAKDSLITPQEYEMHAFGDFTKQRIGKAYREYQAALRKNNAMDFDDLIMKTVELLQSDPEVKNYYQERFHYIMVDEYQDTNTAQFELIRLLAGKYQNLCVVGDDDQSIYKFRGANIYNILNFEKHFPDAKTIKLEQNYRSTQNILNAANSVIANNVGRKSKTLWTANDEGKKIWSYTKNNIKSEKAAKVKEEQEKRDQKITELREKAEATKEQISSRLKELNEALTQNASDRKKSIDTDKPAPCWCVIPASEIIKPRLFVVDIATIPERLHHPQRFRQLAGAPQRRAPRIIAVTDDGIAILIQNRNNIALQALNIRIRRAVVHYHRRAVLRIVEEVQFVAALSHVMNVLAMQGVVGRTRE